MKRRSAGGLTRGVVLFVLVLAAGAQVARAESPPAQAARPQVQSTAQALEPAFLAECSAIPALEHLTTAYHRGDWAAFQAEGRTLLDALRRAATAAPATGAVSTPLADCTKGGLSPPVTAALDYRTRHVALVWIGSSPLGETQVMRAVVHARAPEPYSADLPGVTGFTEVFLASSLDARAVSLYTSTRESDPFVDQLPAVIQAIFGPLSTAIAGILGARSAGREAVTEPKLAVTVSAVVLPMRRASVRAQISARDTVSQDEFRDAVATLGTTLLFDGAGRSARARAQVTALVSELPGAAMASCGPPAGAITGSAVSRSQACRDALDDVLRRHFETAIAGATNPEAQVVIAVDTQFRALAIRALSVSADRDMTFRNRPLTRFTFGAGAAVIADAHLNRVRTKISSDTGLLVSDPLPRVMTLAFVNWSPLGYDEAAAKIGLSERVRPFFGAALTPDFGVVGGVNVLLARGIGVVGGIGWLFGKGADPEEIGKAPAAKEDPFKLAVSRSLFVGISYSYR